jgi:hypothetical protein
MSFQVVRHEHPNILVVNRQTYETYRLTVGKDGLLVQDGAGSDLREAHRAAMAFMYGSERKRARLALSAAYVRAYKPAGLLRRPRC